MHVCNSRARLVCYDHARHTVLSTLKKTYKFRPKKKKNRAAVSTDRKRTGNDESTDQVFEKWKRLRTHAIVTQYLVEYVRVQVCMRARVYEKETDRVRIVIGRTGRMGDVLDIILQRYAADKSIGKNDNDCLIVRIKNTKLVSLAIIQ